MRATGAVREADSQGIPDKLYFRIGEVSRVTGVKQHVLRYWETEFHGISPKKSGSGHRLYRRKDVELILEIKRLLYNERFTIEGARKFLGQKSKGIPPKHAGAQPPMQAELFSPERVALDEVRKELRAILELLA